MRREGGLLAWQWRGYAAAHRDRVNLLLHLVAVPAFIAGVLATANAIPAPTHSRNHASCAVARIPAMNAGTATRCSSRLTRSRCAAG